jgi:hypothetical protein|tara:strand:+ start:449 stop:1945 length:1497 start_codon:yes stop_codon:yes gene_type:complete
MPAIITNKFRLNNAEQFQESFSESAATVYYLGIGRAQNFGTITRPDARTDYEGTETAPSTPGDSVLNEFKNFDDLLAAKKITGSDISFCIPRRNWTTGTTYDIYRHDYEEFITGSTTTRQTANSGATTLFDSTFYVLTADRNVYKCLDNDGDTASTVEPTGTGTSIITTGDGYKWKYMYTLSAAQQANFLSTDFMAVATNSTVAAAAVDGALDTVRIKTAGSSYTVSGGGTSGTITAVPIRGDGSGGICSVVLTSGAVTAVTVTTAGTGYTSGYIRNADILAATNAGGAGSGAELDVIILPKGGHGKNAIEELGGFFVMLNTSLEGTESSNSGDFTAANDFRKISLIKDPQNAAGSAASATTLRGTYAVKIAASPTPGTFTPDEEINQASTGAVGIVVEWDSTNKILYYVQTRHNDAGADSNGNVTAFSGANVITGQASSATGTPDASTQTVNNVSFTSGYSAPELKHDSGDLLYVENRTKITRATDQTENIKLIIEF